MADFPYIGSQICLISNIQIRYEGILYSIDTENGTVTLANVRSFGTEDRSTLEFFPPIKEVYEFIVFRGTNIKDIKLCSEQLKQYSDPAIVEVGSCKNNSETHQLARTSCSADVTQDGEGRGSQYSKTSLSASAYVSTTSANISSGTESKLDSKAFQPQKSCAFQCSVPRDLLSNTPPTKDMAVGTMDHAIEYNAKVAWLENANNTGNNSGYHRNSDRVSKNHGRQHTFNNSGSREYTNSAHRVCNEFAPYADKLGGNNKGGVSRGGYQNHQQQQQMLKFDEEFDFDKANQLYVELTKNLADANINDTQALADTTEKCVTETGEEQQGDRVGQAGAEVDTVKSVTASAETVNSYDKTKSFFDTLSCESQQTRRGAATARAGAQVMSSSTAQDQPQVASSGGYGNRQQRFNNRNDNRRYNIGFRQRQQNVETFGVDGTDLMYRSYGRRYVATAGGAQGNDARADYGSQRNTSAHGPGQNRPAGGNRNRYRNSYNRTFKQTDNQMQSVRS